MLPESCTLAIDSGRQIIVDSKGDVSSTVPETGIDESDHRYLSELSVDVAARHGWEVLGRERRERGISTTLASSAVGSGRGEQRRWTLVKRLAITHTGVRTSVRLTNNTQSTRAVPVSVTLTPDFRHIFEVESFFSPRDNLNRSVTVSPQAAGCTFTGTLADGTENHVEVTGDPDLEPAVTSDSVVLSTEVTAPPASTQIITVDIDLPAGHRTTSNIDTTAEDLPNGDLIERARRTLDSLMLPCGVPAAGAPRFLAPFGRDSLIVGYQLLPFDSTVAERTLRFLAGEQGKEVDSSTVEAPGRIMHEKRYGDRPTVGESVRSPYYGTVDATPLFAALFADTVRQTGNETLRRELYSHAKAAIEWTLDEQDDDGFLRYDSHDHPLGLEHLGWKDSAEALAHPDGTPAQGSIALAEVQGYVYRALQRFEPLASDNEDDELAEECRTAAETLAVSFDADLWLPEQGCYALGADDSGVIPTVASNQGHAVWGGLGSDDRVARVVNRLTNEDMLTSAGLRTVASSHDSYDPLSYHRGSVWPHDTSIAAIGFAERGHRDAAESLSSRGLSALADTVRAGSPERFGFPELMVGVGDEAVCPGTVRHPDACLPAAWSAGSVFGFLQAQTYQLSIPRRS
ncbi:MGH1-like glycoside hydrolase domain-containing protein [Haladaptatus caseinilyticus]|uniref:MGH1-like glycoside hydrolase domain-containing protein n=1 Tax=Haladaptatus caseinilyticus TaxID=2993314 RepID=UPI00224B010D|nr:glycogen debranching N-terminal domain-containing protein [Haladaptatus caseinilyticus]